MEKTKKFVLPRLEILRTKVLGNVFISKISNGVLDILFPKLCFNCQKEGDYLCQDCQSLLEISQHQYCLCQKPKRLFQGGKCQTCHSKKLNGLYFAISYQNSLVKELIQKFKYKPFIKELAETLSNLIITHFQLLDNKPNLVYPVREEKFSNRANFILLPIPLNKKRQRQRGFNQAEEIAKELAKSLKLPVLNDVLLKIKSTLPQVELSEKERKENVKDTFLVKNKETIQNKKILLVDDVYTTGSTMEEAARILKEAGAKEVWGIVVARAQPGEDKFQEI